MTEQMTVSLPSRQTMYRAVLRKDGSFEGIFLIGVKTTGIFCRPTCPAKKPQEQNVEFFDSPRNALLAGYRPCKRCRPLEPKGKTPDWIRPLLRSIDDDPGRRMKESDLRQLDLDPARVRRWFKQHLGITFQGYLRTRRLGAAMGQLSLGENMTQVAFEHGYESLSGFRDAFRKLFGTTPGNGNGARVVTVNRILSPLGPLLAGASEKGICLLEFMDRRMLETQIQRIRSRFNCTFVYGDHPLIARLQEEITEYFEGSRRSFSLPLDAPGSDFQKRAWEALMNIPYGETRSYGEQARQVGDPAAVRAVARANGDNRIAIVIPCHRVIGADGKLSGYGGGVWRKKLLLDLEKKVSSPPRTPPREV